VAEKNKHLTHIEDRILIDGVSGAKEAIQVLKEMAKFLSGKGGANIAITTKWDGAPAIICGTDPADGRFFVGTKSVFAKTEPKLCKSDSDIARMYDGVLANKLRASLRYLPGANIKGVLQGDLMFTDDKKKETIDGNRWTTFRPNTITYAADPKTPLGKAIDRASLGIVFHTKYEGASMPEMSASFNVKDSDFTSGGEVWAEKAEFKDIGNVASFSATEKRNYEAAVKRAEGSVKKAGTIFSKIQSEKKTLAIDTELLKFFNNYVKLGSPIPSVDKAYKEFLFHMGQEYDKAIKKNKTLAAQSDKAFKWLDTVVFVMENEADFKMLIATYMNIQYAKNMLVEKMKKVSELRLFVNMGTHYEATTPEGFVAVSNDRAVKLIDRMEFSKLNFTVPKQWDK